MIIERREANEIREDPSWLLVYGRRKTGKTFILKRSIDWNLYITVARGGYAVVEHPEDDIEWMSVEEALLKASGYVKMGKNIVIDEFQRVPARFWDLISIAKHEDGGRIILCGSSLSIAGKVFDRRSPLLGLFKPLQIGLIHPGDVLNEFLKIFPVKEAFQWSLIARDPWILGLVDPVGDVVSVLIDNFSSLASSVSGLVGEVFEEEDRKLTRLYDSVLRLLALGYWSSGDIAQRLYEAGLIIKPEMSIVTGVLNQLHKMGFIDKVRLLYTRGGKTYYRHSSSLVSLLLYMDEKYGFRDVKPDREDVESRLGIEIQFFIGEVLSEYTGLDRGYLIMPRGEGDIDIILMSKNKPIIGYEVKTGPISVREAKKAVENMRRYGIPKTGLISLTDDPPDIADEALGPRKLKELVRGLRRVS